jgi:hypothetical protein
MAVATGLPDASAWALDPGVAYAMECNPVDFLVHQVPELLDRVRAQLAAFLGADQEGLVLVDNATTGTQTVIAQARLAPGDEVLTTRPLLPCRGGATAPGHRRRGRGGADRSGPAAGR